ncbi:type II toxin-antitoxin system RelB/DinJ family antitoxin [Kosakonia pseudosacchari]|uniref:type II toxin-antitoxin system RelB/DinJ family antitoxin n=1 Tax=Kosakonia pseudosacchari TaxID=1646340 RepID=UPI000A363535|nr:type II toxin-antitoxin system RelB/DinJ family antitoxin [Kosakonia pseudosacchari]QOV64671.1 type II toxin-antitoxin system RelB/DinJ family antitoxin [Kosakonia pseudosacchari]WBU48768.1 type II toxin-antitoxin system RelB/DinJ family antitoxin [Kosakonia pseudosacchari]
MDSIIRSRINSDLKARAGSVLESCGLNWSTAIRLFAEQIVKTEGIPFEVTRKPTARLRKAMTETEDILAHQNGRFDGIDQLMDSLNDGKE